jgi:hypothetical protein
MVKGSLKGCIFPLSIFSICAIIEIGSAPLFSGGRRALVVINAPLKALKPPFLEKMKKTLF